MKEISTGIFVTNENDKNIYMIGDIHGDWDMTMKVLRVAKLIDNNGSWIGGETVVVQVGDQVDRCRYTQYKSTSY